MRSGRLIVFEGPEGGGKSTAVAVLAEKLREAGKDVVRLREPGGTKLGEVIRSILKENAAGEAPCPIAELMLFQAARAQLVGQCIKPALESGCWVLMDRFYDSTMAYQGYGRGLDKDMIRRTTEAATGGLVPDLTFLLHVDVRVGLSRAMKRNDGYDRFDEESKAFHRNVTRGYLTMAVEQKDRNWVIIDALKKQEEVSRDIWDSLVYKMKEDIDQA